MKPHLFAALLSAAILLLLTPAGLGQGAAEYEVYGLPAGEALTLRNGPGASYNAIGTLPAGEDGITTRGKSIFNQNTDWTPVTTAKGRGWVRAKYLRRVTRQPAPAMVEAAPPALVEPKPMPSVRTEPVSRPVPPQVPLVSQPANLSVLEKVEWRAYGHDLAAIGELEGLAEEGNLEAAEALVLLLVRFDPAPKFTAAFDQFSESAAERGEWKGKRALALAYSTGWGRDKNQKEATRLFLESHPNMKAAAEAGDPIAQRFLGKDYENGYSKPKDTDLAFAWVAKGSSQGFPIAHTDMGYYYSEGVGIGKDQAAAVKKFRLAADQGDARGRNELAACYLEGNGVGEDTARAAQLFKQAADQGFSHAQFNLGLCYANGYGVTQNWGQAENWIQKAAAQNCPGAEKTLGEVQYKRGQAVWNAMMGFGPSRNDNGDLVLTPR